MYSLISEEMSRRVGLDVPYIYLSNNVSKYMYDVRKKVCVLFTYSREFFFYMLAGRVYCIMSVKKYYRSGGHDESVTARGFIQM